MLHSHDPVVALVLWPVPPHHLLPSLSPWGPQFPGSNFHMNSGKRERRGVRCSPGLLKAHVHPLIWVHNSLRPPKTHMGHLGTLAHPPVKLWGADRERCPVCLGVFFPHTHHSTLLKKRKRIKCEKNVPYMTHHIAFYLNISVSPYLFEQSCTLGCMARFIVQVLSRSSQANKPHSIVLITLHLILSKTLQGVHYQCTLMNCIMFPKII